jgi:exosortase
MASVAINEISRNTRRHASFVGFIAISGIVFYKTVAALVTYSLHDESSSHIVMIPLIAFFLLYAERERIFAMTQTSAGLGITLTLAGFSLYWVVSRGALSQDGNWPLTLSALSLVLVWVGGFLLCYGLAAFRAAAFPLLFLLLMIPLPDVVLDRVIHALQAGSTEIACLIFQAVGTPVSRNGFLLSVPGVTIEVAKECSSIRSSVALLITCLLAAHLYLRTTWKMALFVIVGIIVSVLKNGVRIATLTLLSLHVDPGFLTGRLHHQGGFVFFIMALLILWPLFLWLEKSDARHKSAENTAHTSVADRASA